MFSMFDPSKKDQNAEKTTLASKKKHITRKKKNTYVVQMNYNTFSVESSFEMSREMPLYVKHLNGKEHQNGKAFVHKTNFPNPAATSIVQHYEIMSHIMGKKMAGTIIEYLDKETAKPVLQLYPDRIHVFDGFDNNYMSRLNHASRRDFKFQMERRRKLLEIYNKAR